MQNKHISFPDNLLEQLEDICKKEGKNFSQLIREISEDYISRYNGKESMDAIEKIIEVELNNELQKINRRFLTLLTKIAVTSKTNEYFNKYILDTLKISKDIPITEEELLISAVKDMQDK